MWLNGLFLNLYWWWMSNDISYYSLIWMSTIASLVKVLENEFVEDKYLPYTSTFCFLWLEFGMWSQWSTMWQDVDWICTVVDKWRNRGPSAVIPVRQKLLWYSIILCSAKQRQDWEIFNGLNPWGRLLFEDIDPWMIF